MITTFLAELKDFRRPQAQRYKIQDVILFSILALLCNSKSYRDIHRFMKTHFEKLKKDFSLNWSSPPAYTTIRNIIKGTPAEDLEAAFRAYTQSLVHYNEHATELLHIAVDGKVLCNSYDNFNDKNALWKLMFFDADKKLILGHVSIEDKSNEIPAVQSLLQELELKNVVFTIDALHCQKKTFDLCDTDNALLVQLKENQSYLLQDVQLLAANRTPCDTYTPKTDAGHGRLTQRTTKVYQKQIDQFILDEHWLGCLKTIVCVERKSEIFNTKKKCYEQRNETAWYVSNTILSAEQSAKYVLNHWGIENSNHYVRDVSLAEDASRIRCNSTNIAILRSWAMNAMRVDQRDTIKGELYTNSLDWNRLYTYSHII